MKKYNGLLNSVFGTLLIGLGVLTYFTTNTNLAIEIPVHDTLFMVNSLYFIIPFIIYFIIAGIIDIKERKRFDYRLSLLHFCSATIFGFWVMQHFLILFARPKRYYSFSTLDNSSIFFLIIGLFLFLITPQVFLILNLIRTKGKLKTNEDILDTTN